MGNSASAAAERRGPCTAYAWAHAQGTKEPASPQPCPHRNLPIVWHRQDTLLLVQMAQPGLFSTLVNQTTRAENDTESVQSSEEKSWKKFHSKDAIHSTLLPLFASIGILLIGYTTVTPIAMPQHFRTASFSCQYYHCHLRHVQHTHTTCSNNKQPLGAPRYVSHTTTPSLFSHDCNSCCSTHCSG